MQGRSRGQRSLTWTKVACESDWATQGYVRAAAGMVAPDTKFNIFLLPHIRAGSVLLINLLNLLHPPNPTNLLADLYGWGDTGPGSRRSMGWPSGY